ncbi:hypothetical protein J6590_034559 [Homalodisca vitripennis]|nr:hypothetical protein J6590_034559 [Homalodisca vitripennis]
MTMMNARRVLKSARQVSDQSRAEQISEWLITSRSRTWALGSDRDLDSLVTPPDHERNVVPLHQPISVLCTAS